MITQSFFHSSVLTGIENFSIAKMISILLTSSTTNQGAAGESLRRARLFLGSLSCSDRHSTDGARAYAARCPRARCHSLPPHRRAHRPQPTIVGARGFAPGHVGGREPGHSFL